MYPGKWIKNALWYGGMGGILSDLISGYSPYDGGGVDEFRPAPYDTWNSFVQEFTYVIGGEKSILKGVGSFAEDNIMLYGQSKKYLERTDNILLKAKLNGDRININKKIIKFEKNFKDRVMTDKEKVKNQRELMYENLKEYFYLGTKQEFHKELIATALELTTQIYQELRGTLPTKMKGKSEEFIDNSMYKKAYEEAWSRLMTNAKGWNPYSRYSFKKDTSDGRIISSQFFLYSAGIVDGDNKNRIDDAEADVIKNWIATGGRDSRGIKVPAEDVMSGYPLKLWNELHSAEDRFYRVDPITKKSTGRLKEYLDLFEIANYADTLKGINDPILNLKKNISMKKSPIRKSWVNLMTP